MYTKSNAKTKLHIMCANCGRFGHEVRYCSDGVVSLGIINLRIDGNICEHLLIQEKFSTQQNSYYIVTSKKYPNIKVNVTDNFKLCTDNTTSYKIEDVHVTNQTNETFLNASIRSNN